MNELGVRELVLIHATLNFAVHASATNKRGQASTGELVRVRGLVERVIKRLGNADAVKQAEPVAHIFHKPT